MSCIFVSVITDHYCSTVLFNSSVTPLFLYKSFIIFICTLLVNWNLHWKIFYLSFLTAVFSSVKCGLFPYFSTVSKYSHYWRICYYANTPLLNSSLCVTVIYELETNYSNIWTRLLALQFYALPHKFAAGISNSFLLFLFKIY